MWRLYVLSYVAYVYYVFQGCLNNGVHMYYPVWKKHNLLIRTDHLQMFIMTVVWTSLNYMIKYSLFIHVTQRLTCSELTTVRVDTRLFKRIPVIFKALFCVSDHHSFFNDFVSIIPTYRSLKVWLWSLLIHVAVRLPIAVLHCAWSLSSTEKRIVPNSSYIFVFWYSCYLHLHNYL